MKLAEHFPLSSYLAGHHTAWRRNYTNSELACHAIGQSLAHPTVKKILLYSVQYPVVLMWLAYFYARCHFAPWFFMLGGKFALLIFVLWLLPDSWRKKSCVLFHF
jgi:hypothetical protein